MSFVVHLFLEPSKPSAEAVPMLLLADGKVISRAVSNPDGTLVFDCNVPPDAELALRIDVDHEAFKPGT
jgi:hypothetical protein